MTKSEASDRILVLRKLIMVNAYSFFKLNTKIIEDSEYDKLINELAKLQHQYEPIAIRLPHAQDFDKSGKPINFYYTWVAEEAKRRNNKE